MNSGYAIINLNGIDLSHPPEALPAATVASMRDAIRAGKPFLLENFFDGANLINPLFVEVAYREGIETILIHFWSTTLTITDDSLTVTTSPAKSTASTSTKTAAK